MKNFLSLYFTAQLWILGFFAALTLIFLPMLVIQFTGNDWWFLLYLIWAPLCFTGFICFCDRIEC